MLKPPLFISKMSWKARIGLMFCAVFAYYAAPFVVRYHEHGSICPGVSSSYPVTGSPWIVEVYNGECGVPSAWVDVYATNTQTGERVFFAKEGSGRWPDVRVISPAHVEVFWSDPESDVLWRKNSFGNVKVTYRFAH